MTECGICDKLIDSEKEGFVEMEITTWEAGQASGKSKDMELHLACFEYQQQQEVENKLIRENLLKWQKECLNTPMKEGKNIGRFLAQEIEDRMFTPLKQPVHHDKLIEPKSTQQSKVVTKN